MLRIKRIYEPTSPSDGRRYLVDRLWPRGVSKEDAHVEAWKRELSPSDGLRRWYGHDISRYAEFREKYLEELKTHGGELLEVAKDAMKDTVTLVFSAKDTEHSNASVLKEVIEGMMLRPAGRRGH